MKNGKTAGPSGQVSEIVKSDIDLGRLMSLIGLDMSKSGIQHSRGVSRH